MNGLSVRTNTILGVPVWPLTMAEAKSALDGALEEARPLGIAFLNAHMALLAHEHPRFRRILQHFMVLNDGVGVDIGCRMKYGVSFPENLNGTDFIPGFLEGTRHRLRIYLLGARLDTVQDAALILAYRYPRHTIAGCHSGFFRQEESERIAQDIRRARANVILVAMGGNVQERWIAEHLEKTGATLALGVGAFFDLVAHRFPRAPRFVRKARAEWLWRLMCEPRRLGKRYTIGNAKFLAYSARDALAYRLGNRVSEAP